MATAKVAKWAFRWDGTKAVVTFDGVEFSADKGEREASFYALRDECFPLAPSYDSAAVSKRKGELMRQLWQGR